jgi:hypothetical protein
MEDTWAVLDPSDMVVNVIVWDGVAPIMVPQNHTVIEVSGQKVGIGWQYDGNGGWIGPPEPSEEPA